MPEGAVQEVSGLGAGFVCGSHDVTVDVREGIGLLVGGGCGEGSVLRCSRLDCQDDVAGELEVFFGDVLLLINQSRRLLET